VHGVLSRKPKSGTESSCDPAPLKGWRSVPAPVGAGTDDERDECGKCHSPLEERGRIQRACIPPNHEIFTSQEMSAVSPVRWSNLPVSMRDCIPRKGEVERSATLHTRVIPRRAGEWTASLLRGIGQEERRDLPRGEVEAAGGGRLVEANAHRVDSAEAKRLVARVRVEHPHDEPGAGL